ncbi:MAG: hypothetical protein K0S37_2532 [Microbacterium sp.]|jgi:2-hydroxy-3-oxopropionate reductase|nr:hypothetical protein [Microbacterium sp.]
MIGLGAMGEPMARHLLRARGELVFLSRSDRPDLAAAGATRVASARELGEMADIVVSVLPDLPELRPFLDGPDGLCASPHPVLLVISSTSSPTGVRELAAYVRELSDGRIRVVDAPVSGGVDGAEAGRLSIMLGGSDNDTARVAEALAPCGTAVHLGPLGAGQVAKACNQMVVASTILALGEASVLAERSGIDLETLWSLLAGGYAGSNLLDSRKDKLVSDDDSPSGVAKYLIKDLSFAADVAESTGTAAVLLPSLRGAFAELVAAGFGDRDISVTRRFVANRPAPESP